MMLGIGQQLCKMLGAEVEPLTYLVPELEEFISEFSTTSYSDGSGVDGIKERWKYSFRVLTRLLTSYVKPLVIVMDDLQWADKGSLDLIKDLIADTQNINPLMVIGLYRSNEVDETSELSTLLSSLKENGNYVVAIHEIALEGFSSKEVNQMIMKMMDSDDEERTMDLAEVCFQRTLGNPFFVIEFMTMLHREELIDFNIGTMKWMYDVAKIENATMSTANVVELLHSRMKQMPDDVQMLLSIAACLGQSFRVPILELVWKNLVYVESNGFLNAKVSELIGFIQQEMLVEPGGVESFRWVHDKVQEAALTFVEVDKDAFKFAMGKILYLQLVGKELEDDLFDVADLISSGKNVQSADFASFFLRAAKKARRMSAFASSTRYVQVGIAMLPDNHWNTYKSLTVDLYTMGAQVELALGNVSETKNYCSAVLTRADVALELKIPFRVVEMKRLLQVELEPVAATKTGLAALKEMGFRFRWHRSLVAVQALTSLSKTIKAVKRLPKDFHLRLGKLDDRNKAITEILHLLMQVLMHTRKMMQVVLCSCHIVQLTLKHGLSEYSATHFASLGNLAVIVFQMHKDAPLFREVALETQNLYGKNMAAHTIFTVYGFGLAWKLRMDTLTETFHYGYIQGMQNGDVDVAMWLLFTHCVSVPSCLGKPIDSTLEALPAAALQMDELSQTTKALAVKCFWQMLLILQQDPAKVEDPCVIKGNLYNKEDCQGDKFVLGIHGYFEFELLLFFDDPSAADVAIATASKLARSSSGAIGGIGMFFHRGVSLYVAARRNKHRKYKKHAKKIRKTMHKWKEQGNPNVVYYCIFLDAEQAALDDKHDEAEPLYKQAIQFAARSGILHHAGLFNERYADFLMHEQNDVEEAKYRLEEAMRYYKDWGAHGVVERVKESSLMQEATASYA